jgi:hypothetical protein
MKGEKEKEKEKGKKKKEKKKEEGTTPGPICLPAT